MYLAKSRKESRPEDSSQLGKVRTTFKIPPLTEGEETIEMVTAVRLDAPFEYITLGGINFEKRVWPPEAGYVENIGEKFEAGVLVKHFSQKQIDALSKYIETRTQKLPSRLNPKYTEDGDEPEYLLADEIEIAPYIIFMPVADYDPKEHRLSQSFEERADIENQEDKPVTRDELERFRQELLDIQTQTPVIKKGK